MRTDKTGRTQASSVTATTSELNRRAVFGDQSYTVEEVTGLLGVNKAKVLKLIADRELVAIKLGKGYQIWEQDLRRFQQEALLRAHLERRQRREPDRGWSLEFCFRCGDTAVLVTRHQRLDHDIYCDKCREQHDFNELQTKDSWDRAIQLEVMDRNHQEGDVDAKEWRAERCPICEKPYALSNSNLKDIEFYPFCGHGKPYLEVETQEISGRFEGRVIMHLAKLELELRNSEDSSLGWMISRCARCGEERAVSAREDRLIGDTICRICKRNDKQPSRECRAEIVSDEEWTNMFEPVGCNCGGKEVSDVLEDGKVVLSWCRVRSFAERESMADSYGRRLKLSVENRKRLMVSVLNEPFYQGYELPDDRLSENEIAMAVRRTARVTFNPEL